MKIDEARSLLRETDLSVTEIAAMLGFSELKYFCALFKRLVGVTPMTYRSKKEKKT